MLGIEIALGRWPTVTLHDVVMPQRRLLPGLSKRALVSSLAVQGRRQALCLAKFKHRVPLLSCRASLIVLFTVSVLFFHFGGAQGESSLCGALEDRSYTKLAGLETTHRNGHLLSDVPLEIVCWNLARFWQF